MSSYKRETKHPITGEWQVADWLDDYFGRHRYGVKFREDVFEADKYEWETRDNAPVEMPLPTETMEERFRKIGEGSVRFIATRDEVLAFIESELSLSQNRILEEVERMKMKWKRTILWKEHYKSGYNQALQDIIKLISKKDNQSTLTKGN